MEYQTLPRFGTKADSRDTSGHDIAEVNDKLGTVLDQVKVFGEHTKDELTRFKTRIGDIEQKLDRTDESEPAARTGAKLADLIDFDRFRAASKGVSTGPVAIAASIRALRKAALTSLDVNNPSLGGWPISPTRTPDPVLPPAPRLTVLDLLPRLKVETSSFEFVRMAISGGADYQTSQGAPKAESDIGTALQTAKIATIAHWTKASKQVLADVPALSQWVGRLLLRGVLEKAQTELIGGNGLGGNILGLLPQATAYSPAATHPADMIGESLADLQSTGWTPNGIVLHPKDWFAIASERATGGDEQYVIGGPRNPSPPSLWNTPVILCAGMPRFTALTGDFTQALLLDREEADVQANYEGNDFTKNLVTLLAEARLGLAVFDTSALHSFSIGGSST